LIANSEIESHPLINRIDVQSVDEMKSALDSHFSDCDYLFMAAAISDVRPQESSQQKIKKAELNSISLIENPDLLASLPADGPQIVIAFAAETDKDSILEAQSKMVRKNADLVYLNNVSDGAIFGSEKTSGSIIDASGVLESFNDISKENLAHSLINHAISKSSKLG
jgi:phosphopantothenoylcysteine decarboxylase/phosphopantothenate--cysteine ligase